MGDNVKLILVRHAAAVERGGGVPEDYRYLTPEGRIYFRKTAGTMAGRGIAPDLILTSPLLRAVQTADILAEAIAYNPDPDADADYRIIHFCELLNLPLLNHPLKQ